jgi:hypothetical protein
MIQLAEELAKMLGISGESAIEMLKGKDYGTENSVLW